MKTNTWIPETGEWVARTDTVTSEIWATPFQVHQRARLKINGVLTDQILLHDENEQKHPLAECVPLPGQTEMLADWEVAIVVEMCRIMIDTNDFTDLELLDTLNPQQRRQVLEAVGYAPALHRAIAVRCELDAEEAHA